MVSGCFGHLAVLEAAELADADLDCGMLAGAFCKRTGANGRLLINITTVTQALEMAYLCNDRCASCVSKYAFAYQME